MQIPERIFPSYFFVIATVFILALLAPSGAGAVSWTCTGTNWWDNTSCWDTGLVPSTGENVDILNSGSSDVTVDYRNSLNPTLSTLTLDANVTGWGTILNQSQDTITATNEKIGIDGNGAFFQTGGTNTVTNDLTLGLNTGSSGTYVLSGGTLNVGGDIVNGSGTSRLLLNGGTLNVGGGSIGVDYFALTITSLSNASYDLGSGSLTAASEFIGVDGTGVFNQAGGTNTVAFDPALVGSGNLYVGYNYLSAGTYNLSGGSLTSLTADNEYIGIDGIGTFNQTGGTNTVTNDLRIGFTRPKVFTKPTFEDLVLSTLPWPFHKDLPLSGATSTGVGVYNLLGGTLTAANLINEGTFNYFGGVLNADVTNSALFSLSGPGMRTINGDFINSTTGTIKITNTLVNFTGLFTNYGGYISDPSSNYFMDLVVADTGYIQGGAGDYFFVSGNYTNNSTQTALWDTVNAYLSFTGSGSHEFYMNDWSTAANFAWGGIEVADGGGLMLTGALTGDLYVGELILGLGSSLDLNGFNIYYSTFTNLGGTYTGGTLYDIASVPEPSTLLLLGSGLAGLGYVRRRFKA